MRADRSVGTQRSEGVSYEASRTRDSVPTAENRVSENGWKGFQFFECVSFSIVQRTSLKRAMETEWRWQKVAKREGRWVRALAKPRKKSQ